jgi:phage-related protein
MYTAKIENSNGEILTLTGNEPVYQVIDITGLNPPKAQINTSTIVGLDGAVFNSSKLETRNLVLTVKINGDIESNRQQLYNYFRTKSWCKFYFTNNNLDVSIEGYVESVECDLFTNNETAQISIICPYPYFKSLAETLQKLSHTNALFTFPFTINLNNPVVISEYTTGGINVFNSSESDTGAMIEIDISNSVSSIEIKNTNTGDDFVLNYAFQSGDKVIINTNKGQKSITLVRSGRVSNLFSALKQGSVFFQLQAGSNMFEYLADGEASSDDIRVLFRYYNVYRGV